MRDLGYCNRGAREWFARQGLSWPDFVENGVDAERLRATGDAMAEKVCEHAERLQDGQ